MIVDDIEQRFDTDGTILIGRLRITNLFILRMYKLEFSSILLRKETDSEWN